MSPARPGRGWSGLGEVLAAGAGMVLFALFIHKAGPVRAVAWAGLGLAAVVLVRSLARAKAPAAVLGLAQPGRSARGVGVGVLAGLVLGFWYRHYLGEPVLSQGFGGFALVAGLIGGTEEFVYRGWMQGRARPFGAVGAVVLAAAMHTAYKTALFAAPPPGAETDLVFLAVVTLLGGTLFGAMREMPGGLWAPLAAHVTFDLVVYAELAEAPWWVWH